MADQSQTSSSTKKGQTAAASKKLNNGKKGDEPKKTDVKVPEKVTWQEAMLEEGSELAETIMDKAMNVIASSEKLSQMANMAYCVGRAITNPTMLLNSLSMVGNNILAATLQMAERIVNVAYAQICEALGQFTSAITNLLNSALNFINSMIGVLDAILGLFKKIDAREAASHQISMSDEDCEYMFASMAACMLNKLLGSKLRKLEEKITNKITDTGQKLNSAIAEELADVNSMSANIDRQTAMMKKAERQIKGWDTICFN